MSFGLGRLRLSHRDFWSMTPRELARAIAAHAAPLPDAPRSGELAKLMARFPDHSETRR